MTENSTETSTATQEVEKQTVAQKVDALQGEKSTLTAQLNSMPEGADKQAAQERITVIDRKLRWYAGRSGEGKTAKAARPSKPAGEKKARQPKAPAPAAAPVPPSANES